MKDRSLDLMKKILIICTYPLNTVPGQRLKYEQYLEYLSKKGYKFEVIPFLTLILIRFYIVRIKIYKRFLVL